MLMSPESGRLFHRWQHVRSWTPLTLQDMLQQRGFSPVEIGTADFSASPYAHRRDRSLPVRMVRAAAKRAALMLGRKPPHLFAVARQT